jgi:PhnB protein
VRDGYRSVNPYVVVDDVEGFLAFLCDVLDGDERGKREIRTDASIGHAEVQIGDSVVMVSAATEEAPARPCVNFAYVEQVDRVFERAVAAGATHLNEPKNWPWGDRIAGFHDPFDNRWWVATNLGKAGAP